MALRPYDILARYGGEEFSVILPGCELEDALNLVERLRAGTPEGESCSAGIAEWDGEERPEPWSAAPTRRSTGPSAAAGTASVSPSKV